MKLLTRVCCKCRTVRSFEGEDVKEVLAAIDAAGWIDRPDEYGDLCAECAKKEAADASLA